MKNDDAQVPDPMDKNIREQDVEARPSDNNQTSASNVDSTAEDLRERLRDKSYQRELILQAAQRAKEETAETVIGDVSEDPTAVDTEAAGDEIRQYILIEKVGAGGFGTVWRAFDSKLECDVALKIPRKDKQRNDEIERFIHEARVSARLRRHPYIVSTHEAVWDNDTAFIASDLIEGESLAERLDRGNVAEEPAVELLIQVCEALDHAHSEGIIHRDLKPDNILLDTDGAPHVTDFGLARREHHDRQSGAGLIMGTISYMPPEQASGNSQQADRRSDVYSLGVVMYEMLTGELPFRGRGDRILQQIMDDDPPRLRDFDSRIDLDLETICLKCLEKDPGLRYENMNSLKADLQRHQKGQPIEARPISNLGKLWRWCKRHPVIPWLSLSLLLVTLTATAAAGFILNRHVADNQDEVIEVMQHSLMTAAFFATKDAELTLEEGFEAVNEWSENENLKDALRLANQATRQPAKEEEALPDRLRRFIGSLTFPAKSETLTDASDVVTRLEHIGFPTPSIPIEQVLIEAYEDKDSKVRTFSWFVCGRDGHQIARYPLKETLGENFRRRSYFNGQKEYDINSKEKITVVHDGWERAQLSQSFVTQTKDAIVVAISRPVRDGNEVLGVAGVFVELGELLELPDLPAAHSEIVKLSIFDPRHVNKEADKTERALLIQNSDMPNYIKWFFRQKDSVWPPENLLVELTTADSTADAPVRDIDLLMNFRDPLDDSLTSEWLAVRGTASLPASENETTQLLHVVAHASLDHIVTPSRHLQSRLIFLGLSVLGLSTAILIPIWIIIIRRVLKD